MDDVNRALSEVKIRGRVETVDIPAPYTVILDFAHNGIGVENLIRAVRDYHPNRVIAVLAQMETAPKYAGRTREKFWEIWLI